MEKIFYTNNVRSEEALKSILSNVYGIEEEILRTPNGKPYLKSERIFFSVSHTQNRLFIAFSSENVGIDAEYEERNSNFLPVLKKFSAEEKNLIRSERDFLRLWTKKESVVKYLGGSIAKDLKKVVCPYEKAYYDGKELPCVFTELAFDGVLLSVYGKSFQEIIPTFYHLK